MSLQAFQCLSVFRMAQRWYFHVTFCGDQIASKGVGSTIAISYSSLVLLDRLEESDETEPQFIYRPFHRNCCVIALPASLCCSKHFCPGELQCIYRCPERCYG